MALVVRIRRAHDGVRRGVVAAQGPDRTLAHESYARACELVGGAYRLATQADSLRARLDAAAAADPRGAAATIDARRSAEYTRAAEELRRVATALEAFGEEVSRSGDGAAPGAIADELEQLRTVMREVEEAVRR